MKLDEIIKILTNRLDRSINQTNLADSLGITRQTVSNRIKNKSELTVSEMKKIEQYFNITILDKIGISYSNIMVNYYPDIFVSCGNGAVIFSDNKETIAIPQNICSGLSNKKLYSIIHARGDSMMPFIMDDDKLIVEHCNNEQIIDNKVYVFCYRGEYFVKRLSKNVDEIIISSDNTIYNTIVLKEEELNNINIIGRIKGIIRAL